jgi:hypothetical protein
MAIYEHVEAFYFEGFCSRNNSANWFGGRGANCSGAEHFGGRIESGAVNSRVCGARVSYYPPTK